MTAPVVFLLDVDNTLLDNDRVAADLKRYLTREVGADPAIAAYPPADVTIGRIDDLLGHDLPALLGGGTG